MTFWRVRRTVRLIEVYMSDDEKTWIKCEIVKIEIINGNLFIKITGFDGAITGEYLIPGLRNLLIGNVYEKNGYFYIRSLLGKLFRFNEKSLEKFRKEVLRLLEL